MPGGRGIALLGLSALLILLGASASRPLHAATLPEESILFAASQGGYTDALSYFTAHLRDLYGFTPGEVERALSCRSDDPADPKGVCVFYDYSYHVQFWYLTPRSLARALGMSEEGLPVTNEEEEALLTARERIEDRLEGLDSSDPRQTRSRSSLQKALSRILKAIEDLGL